ncbi:5-methyltetrahydropteroyltriglutamate-homocysteine S-methyltransferase [Trypanosoma theileri]|uniref:5-methyltetrahydropteroyltriglutamate--homocysteine S-methyltransferase n=1 Tax=Trypanosoma theileri TaxID=67003 RepID=A0A1X0NXM1_9TRYP|nr:5-methyltetrahydropteroyltriglutamate-homocysteine S-methyltransferase [Trypanosoma theileri]ORC89233.1 5-methyltetrahydropteroyltriglutamate-homocysteine S-methyltransferase [Trypanosoma theileri]
MASGVVTHTLGFPRVGVQRELKKALEAYWAGKEKETGLRATGSELRLRHWKQQMERGVDMIPVGDFHWYDHMLAASLMLNNVPPRHQSANGIIDIDTLFRIGRGRAPTGTPAAASEMTKWFNTNYHYIVPEFVSPTQNFSFAWPQLLEEVDELLKVCEPRRVKPILVGPVTYLLLGKVKAEEKFDRLSLLPRILPVYVEVLKALASRGIQWVQIDEPTLVLELETPWLSAFKTAYDTLRQQAGNAPKILLTTYFEGIGHNLSTIKELAVDGLHLDLVAGHDDIMAVEKALPKSWVLSAGVINGRNVWRADLNSIHDKLEALRRSSPHRALWVGTSCSLLHSPVDLDCETKLDAELKSWLAFALQKCDELSLLCSALSSGAKDQITAYSACVHQHHTSKRVINETVRERVSKLTKDDAQRSLPYLKRAEVQHKLLKLPLWPTTTIGSFPQTPDIRTQRLDFKKGRTTKETYTEQLKDHIKQMVKEQEEIELDVLVHGEPERNDMVEYFGELMSGFVFTENGWVQSYGSRCVKPPIIFGDVSRPAAMTVEWSAYAQSLTQKPMKGMLTGPVTILCWSFPREDLSRKVIAQQLALALREEVNDLQNNGIHVIQVDEPAVREGLPLKKQDWPEYLRWAAEAFKITVALAKPETQIHTHMCYSEVNEIIETIAAMDADVITLEAARSDMELLEAFDNFTYPNEIGPGVYDIHSPNVPTVKAMVELLLKAAQRVPMKRLWVNPDCGLKTRGWPETRASLKNMVEAAKELRKTKTE